MSRIYDHLKSLETQIAREKTKHGEKLAAHEELPALVTDGQEHDRQREDDRKREAQERLEMAEARKRTAEQTRLAEEHAARLAAEARLEKLARDRAQIEQAEQAALEARLEAERQLTAQLAARAEQERLEREQIAKRATYEEQLRLAAAEREAQERQAIEEARKRAAEEARLEKLARERAQTEQAEQAALAARSEAERQLAAQLAARAEQERIEREQAARRVAQEEQLRLAAAEREAHERLAIEETRRRAAEEKRRAEEHAARLAEEARLAELARQRAEHEEQLKLAAVERGAQERLSIKAARERATEEARRVEEQAARLAEEVRLEELARERAQAEQAEQAALAARLQAERQLAAQVASRVEQEKIECEQSARRVAYEEQLRQVAAERDDGDERHPQGDVLPTVTRKAFHKGHLIVALLALGAGMFAVVSSGPPGNAPEAERSVGGAPAHAKGAMPSEMTDASQNKTDIPPSKEIKEELSLHFADHLSVERLPSGGGKGVVKPETARRESAGKAGAMDKEVTKAIVTGSADDWESRSGMVREQLKAQIYADAGKNAQALARDFSEHWESWFLLGTAQLAQGQIDAADQSLEHAIQLNSKVARVWIQRAILAQERGDYVTAIRLLDEARKLAPKSPQVYLNLGYSHDALGQTAEAEKNYRYFVLLTDGDGSYSTQREPLAKRLGGKH